MQTLKQLQDQIADLQKQAEAARANEVDGALTEIRRLMSEFSITNEDLFGPEKKGRKKQVKGIQFSDKQGNTWSGRGRMPAWLKGQDKEQFRVV